MSYCNFRESPFYIYQGPDLPKAMAGHCQVVIDNGKIFIYGGISSVDNKKSRNSYNFIHDEEAYVWSSGHWLKVNISSPCPPSRQPIVALQQCAARGSNEVVILSQNFENSTSCTRILDIHNLKWTRVSSMTNLPLGGFILTGINTMEVYYLGGYTKSKTISNSNRTVFKLKNEWTLISMKLPFAMTSWDSIVLDSRLNVTQCMADVHHWPRD